MRSQDRQNRGCVRCGRHSYSTNTDTRRRTPSLPPGTNSFRLRLHVSKQEHKKDRVEEECYAKEHHEHVGMSRRTTSRRNNGPNADNQHNSTTPLHLACWRGDLECCKYLLEECHADANAIDGGGNTPLHLVCAAGHLLLFRYLIAFLPTRKRSMLSIPNKHKELPMDLVPPAQKAAFLDMRACLHNDDPHSAQPRLCLEHDITHAAYHRRMNLLRHVMAVEPREETVATGINELSDNGTTALHVVCRKGYLFLLRYMLEVRHADATLRDQAGNTALHAAAEFGQLDILRYLFHEEHQHATAMLHASNQQGQTPLQLAQEQGQHHVVEYLSLHLFQGKCTKEGQCLGCGTQCFEANRSGWLNNLSFRKNNKSQQQTFIPLSVPNLVKNGICLVCRHALLQPLVTPPPRVPIRPLERVLDDTHRLCASYPYAQHQSTDELVQRIRALEQESGVSVAAFAKKPKKKQTSTTTTPRTQTPQSVTPPLDGSTSHNSTTTNASSQTTDIHWTPPPLEVVTTTSRRGLSPGRSSRRPSPRGNNNDRSTDEGIHIPSIYFA